MHVLLITSDFYRFKSEIWELLKKGISRSQRVLTFHDSADVWLSLVWEASSGAPRALSWHHKAVSDASFILFVLLTTGSFIRLRDFSDTLTWTKFREHRMCNLQLILSLWERRDQDIGLLRPAEVEGALAQMTGWRKEETLRKKESNLVFELKEEKMLFTTIIYSQQLKTQTALYTEVQLYEIIWHSIKNCRVSIILKGFLCCIKLQYIYFIYPLNIDSRFFFQR